VPSHPAGPVFRLACPRGRILLATSTAGVCNIRPPSLSLIIDELCKSNKPLSHHGNQMNLILFICLFILGLGTRAMPQTKCKLNYAELFNSKMSL